MAIEKGLFVAVFTTLRTHCAVWQKTAPLLNIILHVKMIVHFVLPLPLLGQAQLSSGLLLFYNCFQVRLPQAKFFFRLEYSVISSCPR